MKKELELKKVNETPGTVIFGEEGDDKDRLKSLYLPKSWFKKDGIPETLSVVISSKSKKKKDE